MTQLIVDSGSTSAKWCLKNESDTETYYTQGLNPYYHDKQSISGVIKTKLIPQLNGHSVDQLYFYGAGCDNAAPKKVMRQSLSEAFTDTKITVEHDLLGSVRACLFNRPGIVCILGTGSNSCLYDGHQIVEHIPTLGFIIGDEGSAGYFGKQLINQYFRGEMSADLKDKLEDSYNMNLQYIMENVYRGSQPSRFVASYAKFLGDNRKHPLVKKILVDGFKNFITRVIKKYTDVHKYAINFVGAVAFEHQKLIKDLLRREGMTPGIFLKDPLSRLIEFHSD